MLIKQINRQKLAKNIFSFLLWTDRKLGYYKRTEGETSSFHSLAGDEFSGHVGKFTHSIHKESGSSYLGRLPIFKWCLLCGFHEDEGWWISFEKKESSKKRKER